MKDTTFRLSKKLNNKETPITKTSVSLKDIIDNTLLRFTIEEECSQTQMDEPQVQVQTAQTPEGIRTSQHEEYPGKLYFATKIFFFLQNKLYNSGEAMPKWACAWALSLKEKISENLRIIKYDRGFALAGNMLSTAGAAKHYYVVLRPKKSLVEVEIRNYKIKEAKDYRYGIDTKQYLVVYKDTVPKNIFPMHFWAAVALIGEETDRTNNASIFTKIRRVFQLMKAYFINNSNLGLPSQRLTWKRIRDIFPRFEESLEDPP